MNFGPPLPPKLCRTGGKTEILRQAAATADEIALFERGLRSQPVLVAGYNGQPRPYPLFKLLQDHRVTSAGVVFDPVSA